MSKLLEYFMKQWNKTDVGKSLEEEHERYSGLAYNDRIIKFISKVQTVKEKCLENNKWM